MIIEKDQFIGMYETTTDDKESQLADDIRKEKSAEFDTAIGLRYETRRNHLRVPSVNHRSSQNVG